MTTPLFQDRRDAGRALARRLSGYAHRSDVRILALPRGGVPVAFEVAHALLAPMEVFVVRKLGVPNREEVALGALAPGVRHVNQRMVQLLGIDAEALDQVIGKEQAELERRDRLYREGRPLPDLQGACVILVDDGLATGSTMHAALLALRLLGPARSVVAVPVAAEDTCAELRRVADEVVCARMPHPFVAVGRWYRDFSQTGDDEVHDLLAAHAATWTPERAP